MKMFQPDQAIHAASVLGTVMGVGGGIGALIAALFSAKTQKGKARAEAADLLVEAAERVGRMNASLDKENKRLRMSLDSALGLVMDYVDGAVSKDHLLDELRKLR